MGGSIQQEGNVEGIVFEDTVPYFDSRLIRIDIPGWTKTGDNTKKHIKIVGNAVGELHLGMHGDGRFTPNDVEGRPMGLAKLRFCDPHFQPTYVPVPQIQWKIQKDSIPAKGFLPTVIQLPGAAVGDPCTVGYTDKLDEGLIITAIVSEEKSIRVTVANLTEKSLPAKDLCGFVQVAVWKHDYQGSTSHCPPRITK